MAKTKKTVFKNEYREELHGGDRLASCCGAQLHTVAIYSLDYYGPMAQDAAGMGIILSDKAPTKALKEHEQLTELQTRNGVLFFTTRHKE